MRIKTRTLTLTFDYAIWTSIVIYYLEAFTIPSFATFQKKGQEISSRQDFFKEQQFDLDLWRCDLIINREHQLSRGIHCTKFGNFLATTIFTILSHIASFSCLQHPRNNVYSDRNIGPCFIFALDASTVNGLI